MPRPGHALQRSLEALTVGVQRAHTERRNDLAWQRMGEMLQQVQMPVVGRVGSTPISKAVKVAWPHPFVYAPAQRDSFFERPHFNLGVELLTDVALSLDAHIVGWDDSDEGYTVGATLRVTAFIPGAAKKRNFNAILHLTFSGMAAPSDNESDTT